MNVLVKNHAHSVLALFFCCACSTGWGQIKTDHSAALLSGSPELPDVSSFFPSLQQEPVTGNFLAFLGNRETADSEISLLQRQMKKVVLHDVTQEWRQKESIAATGTVTTVFNQGFFNPYQEMEEDTIITPASNTSLSGACGELKLLAAPTNPVLDDAANTFDWTYTPGYESPQLYEYTLDGGTLYQSVTAKPIVIPDQNYAAGQVGVRVKESATNYASATLYNTKSLLAGAVPENLLAYSEDFDRASTKRVWETVSGGFVKNSLTTNPFGRSGCSFYNINGSRNSSGRLNTLYRVNAGVAYTISIYVKYDNLKSLRLDLNTRQENVWAIFDIEKGKVNEKGNGCSAAVEAAGNGWFRISISFTASATANPGKLSILNPYPQEGGNDKGYFLFGAQLNRGSSPAKYIKTP